MSKFTSRHKTIAGVLSGALGLVLAYAFVTRALETGSYWQYLGFFFFLTLGIKLITRTFKKNYGKQG